MIKIIPRDKIKHLELVLGQATAPIVDSVILNEQRARKISKAIESKIGFEGDLVKYGIGDSSLLTYSNASFALLDYVLGNEQRARKISKAIESEIGFDGDLVRDGVRDYFLSTYSSVSFAMLLAAKKFKESIN